MRPAKRRMVSGLGFFAVILLFVAMAVPAMAQTEIGANPIQAGSGGKLSENVRFIPYTSLEETWQKSPKGVLIPRDEFERLKREKEAFLARRPASPLPRLESDFVHGRSTFTGRVADKVGEFEAVFVFEMPTDRWALFPLPGGDIGLTQVLLDGQPVGVSVSHFSGIHDGEAPQGRVGMLMEQRKAAPSIRRRPSQAAGRKGQANDFFLAVRGAGRHTVQVKFLAPQIDDPERNELTFRIPRLPMNSFSVALDIPGQYGEVDRSEGSDCREEAGRTVLEGVLGPTDRFTLRWAPRSAPTQEETPPQETPAPVPEDASGVVAVPVAPAVKEEPRVFADSGTLLSVGEGFIRSEALIRLKITRSGIDGISFLIPSGTEVLDVQSANLESYRTQTLATATRVQCLFSSQVRQSCELTMTCDTKMADTSQRVDLPIHRVEGVERDVGYIGIEARTSVEISKAGEPEPGNLQISSVDVTDLPVDLTRRALRPILLSYRYFSPPVDPPLMVQVTRHKDAETLAAAMDLVRATTYLGLNGQALTSLDMVVKNNGQQYLKAWLASGSELEAAQLEGAPVSPQRDASGTYLIPLGGKNARRSAAEPFHVRLTYGAPIPKIGIASRIFFALPRLDIRASRLEWTVYAPDWNYVMPLPSNLEKIYRKVEFLPFVMIRVLFELLLTPLTVLLLLVFLVVRRLYLHFSAESKPDAGEGFSWKPVLGVVVVSGVIFVALTTFSGSSRTSLFGSIGGKLSEQAPVHYAPSARAPMSPSVSGYVGAREEDSGLYDAPGQSAADSSIMEKSMEMKQEMAAGKLRADMAPARSKSNLAGPATLVKRLTTAGRDRGALPVDPHIPQTSNSLFFFKNDLRAMEEPLLVVSILWQPLRIGVSILLGALSLIIFMVLQTLARRGRGLLAWLLVVAFSGFMLAMEERVQDFQEPVVLAIVGALSLFAGWRAVRILVAQWRGAPVAVLALLLLGSASEAGAMAPVPPGEKDPRVEQTIDVFVPYSQLGERLATDSPLVFLQYEDYRYLRDLGLPEPDPTLWMPPVSVTFISCALSGQASDEVVSLKLRMEVQLLGKGVKLIPFPTSRIGIKSLLLDGEPAVLVIPPAGQRPLSNDQVDFQQNAMVVQQQMMQSNVGQAANFPAGSEGVEHAIVTEKTGHAVIEAELVKDLFDRGRAARAQEGFFLGLPPFGAASLDLLINRPRQFVEIEPAAQITTTDLASETRVVAALQPGRGLRVEWRDRVKAPPLNAPTPEPASEPVILQEAKVFVDHEILFSITEGVIVIRDNVVLNVEQSPVGEFLFRIPKDLEVMEVAGGDVASWTVRPAGGDQELKVALHAQRRDQISFTLELERATPAISGEFPLDIPQMVGVGPKAKLVRQKGYFGVAKADGFEAEVLNPLPATPVDNKELPAFIREQAQGPVAFAFKFLAAAAPGIKLTKHEEAVVSTAQIDAGIARTLVSKDGKILTQLELVVRNNNNPFLVLRKLPANTNVLSVVLNGEPVKPGRGDQGEIYVPLIRSPTQGKVIQPFGVVVFLESKIPGFRYKGTANLFLPSMSFDLSQLTWIVSMPEGYLVQENTPDFNPGPGKVLSLPGIVGGTDPSVQRMSNVMSQSVMKSGEDGDSSRKIGGVLPVILSIPETGNQVVCNKLLVKKGETTELRMVFAREWVVSELLLVFSLAMAGLLAWSLVGVYRGTWKGTYPSLILLVISGAAVTILEMMFGRFTSVPALFVHAFAMGIQTGLVFFALWVIISHEEAPAPTPVPAPEKKA